jgi:hypothetical protein
MAKHRAPGQKIIPTERSGESRNRIDHFRFGAICNRGVDSFQLVCSFDALPAGFTSTIRRFKFAVAKV